MHQPNDTPFALPRWLSVGAIAGMCREAGLAFLDGVAADWGKLELASWLCGPYREATRFGEWGRRSQPGGRETAREPPPRPREHDVITDEHLATLLREARWHVLASLESAALPSKHRGFVETALSAGFVVPRRDANGQVAWVPVDARSMRLRDRVESLFAADYLIRPKDYITELAVCHRCEAVLFDPEARRRGDCGSHQRESGVTRAREARTSSVPPGRYTTLLGVGKGANVGAASARRHTSR